jgi:type I restriction enzyme R subunit
MPPKQYSEDELIERPAIELFYELGWTPVNAFDETYGPNGTLGRENAGEVVLPRYLVQSLRKLNPKATKEAIQTAVSELTRDRSVMSFGSANREVYGLLKNGVKVEIRNSGGDLMPERIRVIDWDDPENNDFLLVSQFRVTGDIYKRRADLVGFVNGIPLVVWELKAIHKRLEQAFLNNITDYKQNIPQLFWYNAFIVVSNGINSKLGSISAEWEHFCDWKKISSEAEPGIVSLETILRGTCEKNRLLDLVENFTLFSESAGRVIKIVAKNHQFLGVNNAIQAVCGLKENRGRLGVFWQTQGSGKSYSMVFFAQKVMRKLPGNWTFVAITDRIELDDQLYKNFASVGAVTEPEDRVRADSAEHLKQLLTEDHRYVFTLIQKFRTDAGKRFPKLSDRNDIIVMTDEAHRTQYDIFALNMRDALPKAAFIGFTGTPLIVGEEKTKEVFGDYVSIYDFKQSVDDKATVPLFYENRIPELQLTNDQLNEDIYRVIEEAELDEEQEKKLDRVLSRQYHLITRDERLTKIANDIVRHFLGRGFRGKAMVVCIDKLTAVRMYDKVKAGWARYGEELKKQLAKASDAEKPAIQDKLDYLTTTDMAVVVSQAQNEVAEFKKSGIDITPHRLRMVKEDLAIKFKDPNDPFRLVFLCAMWMTGFDVPSCSTIYLDKPLRNHTLMQTIARANRVFREKVNGLIVDYVGVFRDLQKALAIYAGGGVGGQTPVQEKKELIELLKKAIAETAEFCTGLGIDVEGLLKLEKLKGVRALGEAREAILVNDDSRKKYLALTGRVRVLYQAILPDPRAGQFSPKYALFQLLAEMIRSLADPVDISGVMAAIEKVLDASISPTYFIKDGPKKLDLSRIDFDAIRRHFKTSFKRAEVEKLKAAIFAKLQAMVALNHARMDFLEMFQRLIDEYNAGSANVEAIFEELLKFAKKLDEEERRHVKEQLSEEELAVFDILTKPRVDMTPKEERDVKNVASEMLKTLKAQMLGLEWRKRQQTRASVRLCIEESLEKLPPVYTQEIYREKCDAIYQHIYDNYAGEGQSVYERASAYSN